MIPAFRGKTFTSAALVCLVALLVYFFGPLAPAVTLVDSGELIVAARFLGVAHPPGFPLDVILVYLASLLPIGNIAERINFASAFFAALACAIARDYVENIQGTIEPNSFLLTLDWQVASPMLYTREVEDRRSDIKAVDVLLLRRSWYFDYLRRAYPDMIARSRDKVDVYLAQLRHREKDPEAYKQDAALTRQISEAFDELIHSLVSQEIEVAPVYVTAELFVMGQSGDRDLIQWLNQNFQAVPRGLVFQLLRDRDFHDPGELHLQTRGLIDGTHRFDPDDVVKMKVIPTYRAMLENRGLYLAHFNQPERAAAAHEQARQFAK